MWQNAVYISVVPFLQLTYCDYCDLGTWGQETLVRLQGKKGTSGSKIWEARDDMSSKG